MDELRDTQYNLPIGTDTISRQAVLSLNIYTEKNLYGNIIREYVDIEDVKQLPSIQPDKDKVSNLLYRIYSIESPHLDMNGVIAKKYYCEELWKELFGKESELPRWMT